MNDDPRKKEADELVKQFLSELDACKTEEERMNKVWELIFGILTSARKEQATS